MTKIIFFDHRCTLPLPPNKIWIEVFDTYFQFFEEDLNSHPNLIERLSKSGLTFYPVGSKFSHMYSLKDFEAFYLKLKINGSFEYIIEDV